MRAEASHTYTHAAICESAGLSRETCWLFREGERKKEMFGLQKDSSPRREGERETERTPRKAKTRSFRAHSHDKSRFVYCQPPVLEQFYLFKNVHMKA